MALINEKNIEKLEKHRNNIHGLVSATYTVFEQNGEKYLQIDTYGDPSRQMPEKISQSIQFDKHMAEYLIELMRKVYDL